MDIPEKLATLDIEHRNEEKQNRKKNTTRTLKKWAIMYFSISELFD